MSPAIGGVRDRPHIGLSPDPRKALVATPVAFVFPACRMGAVPVYPPPLAPANFPAARLRPVRHDERGRNLRIREAISKEARDLVAQMAEHLGEIGKQLAFAGLYDDAQGDPRLRLNDREALSAAG